MNKQESKYFYTASLFDEALIELLNTKEIEYISIKELCDRAGVNRSTFYLHYETIYDVLDETIKNIDKKFNSKFNNKTFTKEIDNESLDSLIFINDEYLLPYLEFIKENKKVYLANYSNPHHLNAIKRKDYLFENIFTPILLRFNVPKDEIKFLCSFYLSGTTAIILEWVKNNCEEPIEKIYDIIVKCVRPNYEENNQTI